MVFWKTYQSEFRKNLKVALPIMAGQLGQITVNVADNLMVGHLGAAALAAISLSIAIFVIFLVVGMGISFALPPLVANAHGANEPRRISRYFKHSLIVNLAFAGFSILCMELILPLLTFFGQDPEVVDLAAPYLRISAWSMIPIMFFQTFRCYSDGLSETVPPMIAMISGNVVNIFLNYVLIFGKLGMPALGVTGAAIGTLISRLVMIALIILLLKRWKGLWQPIRQADYKRYRKALFKRILDLGVPTSLQLFFEVSAFAAAALLMGMISKETQAAHQIAINLAAITFMVCTGMGMAATVRVGNQLGQANLQGARSAGFSAVIQTAAFMLVAAFIFILFREYLPTMYIDDSEVISIASLLLIFAAVFQIPDGIQAVSLGMLRGIQDVKIPSLITFVSYWIFGLPVSVLTAFYFQMGAGGVWTGLVVGLTLSASLLTWRFHRQTVRMIHRA
jgi:MATE family multidrug resistance protein